MLKEKNRKIENINKIVNIILVAFIGLSLLFSSISYIDFKYFYNDKTEFIESEDGITAEHAIELIENSGLYNKTLRLYKIIHIINCDFNGKAGGWNAHYFSIEDNLTRTFHVESNGSVEMSRFIDYDIYRTENSIDKILIDSNDAMEIVKKDNTAIKYINKSGSSISVMELNYDTTYDRFVWEIRIDKFTSNGILTDFNMYSILIDATTGKILKSEEIFYDDIPNKISYPTCCLLINLSLFILFIILILNLYLVHFRKKKKKDIKKKNRD